MKQEAPPESAGSSPPVPVLVVDPGGHWTAEGVLPHAAQGCAAGEQKLNRKAREEHGTPHDIIPPTGEGSS